MYYLCSSESGRWRAPGPSPAFSLPERDSATTEADFLSLLFDFLSVLPFFRKPEPGRPAPAGRSEERPQERRALRQILNFHKNAQGAAGRTPCIRCRGRDICRHAKYLCPECDTPHRSAEKRRYYTPHSAGLRRHSASVATCS